MTATVYRDQLAADAVRLVFELNKHHATAPIFGLSWLELRELTGWTWERIDVVVEAATDRRLAVYDYATRTCYLPGSPR